MRASFTAALVIAGAVSWAATDFAHLGPAVGQPMPDFSAPDQNGAVRSLASLLGRNGAVIVFVRSADW